MRKKKHIEEPENTERWLLTYSDLITLLMAFFTIMFAMAQVDADKFKTLSQSLFLAFSHGDSGGGANMLTDFQGTGAGPTKISIMTEDKEFGSVIQSIRKYTDGAGLSKAIQTSIQERGLVVNLSDTVLFESGKADLSSHAQEILDHLGELLFVSGKAILVEGHTDNVPINTARYRSNWQLSTDRATNVIMYWISKWPEVGARLSAAGYGEHRPIASNGSLEGRAKNRRVDIVLLREAASEKEPAIPTPSTDEGSSE
jgi:chemotaxis protein MotB